MQQKHPNNYKKSTGKQVKPDDPYISIIIPAYNVADYICETLDSALAQTFEDFEIIVVNDGSPDTDELEKNLEDYYDRIIYIKQKNGGAAAARNTAILESRGVMLAFLDGDDVWLPEKLASQINFLEKNNYQMIYSNALLFGKTVSKTETFMDKSPSKGEVTPESLLNATCNVLTSSTFVRKDLVVESGLFDEKAFRIEDFDLWFRLCKNGVKIGFQKDVLLKYRIREGSLTGNDIEKAQRTLDALEMVKNKNELTGNELKVWETRLKQSTAELNLEKGKDNLRKGNFAEARKNFIEVNLVERKFKIKLLILSLTVSPKTALFLLKKIRRKEF